MGALTKPEENLTNPKMLPSLKAEHEQVLTLVLAGETPTSAYRQVYDCADNTAKVSSSRLMNSDNFVLHLTQRREEMAAVSRISNTFVLEGLKDIINDHKKKNPAVAVRAYELIGKHLGTFEPKVRDLEQRPAFVGISINMGDKPSVQVIHADVGATIGATKEVKDS